MPNDTDKQRLERVLDAADELEKALRGLIEGEFSQIEISFNHHACNYVHVAEALELGIARDDAWPSAKERARAIEADCIWEVQWYPHTPVGFNYTQASSLREAVRSALED